MPRLILLIFRLSSALLHLSRKINRHRKLTRRHSRWISTLRFYDVVFFLDAFFNRFSTLFHTFLIQLVWRQERASYGALQEGEKRKRAGVCLGIAFAVSSRFKRLDLTREGHKPIFGWWRCRRTNTTPVFRTPYSTQCTAPPSSPLLRTCFLFSLLFFSASLPCRSASLPPSLCQSIKHSATKLYHPLPRRAVIRL